MDADASRICELVSEACALVQQVERGAGGPRDEVELEHIRAELRVLAADTGDAEVADVACALVGDIDAALSALEYRRRDRAA